MPLDATGFTALRAADYLVIIRDDYEARTQLDIDFARDIFLGNITAIMATQLGDVSELLQGVYDSRSPNNSQGIQISDLSSGVGVRRQEASFSRATVTLTGTVGISILTGRQVRGGGTLGDAIWLTTSDVVIGGGGTVDVVVQAEDAGAIAAAVGEIDEIVTPVSGWASVTNAAKADPGDDRETDAELRIRRESSLQISGAGSPAAIRANLLALVIDGNVVLTTAIVLENDRVTPLVVEGVTISGHSLHVIVKPSTLTTAEKEAVAQLIYDLKCASVNTDGTDVVVNIQGEDLLNKPIRFDFVVDVTVGTTITVTMETQQPAGPVVPTFADAKPQIEAALTAFYLALTPGDDVLNLQVSALSAVNGVKSVVVSFDIGGGPLVDVDIKLNELANEGATSVVEAP